MVKEIAQIIIGWSFILMFIFLFVSDTFFNERKVNSNKNHLDNPYSPTSLDHDCADFDTQKDAQLFYEANGGPNSDPHDLDRDNDGIACDWN